MDYLPLFHQLTNQPVLVVGGGDTAFRKITLLRRAGAQVTVVSPALKGGVRSLVNAGNATWHRGVFHPDVLDISKASKGSELAAQAWVLVVSATNNPAVNQAVSDACRSHNVLVNCVDDPARSTVIFPALVDRSPIIVAVSSGGRSPTLARTVRGWIEARLPPALGRLAEFAGERRDRVKAAIKGVSPRQAFWERVFDGNIAESVLRGKVEAAEFEFVRALALEATDKSGSSTRRGHVALVGAGPGAADLLTMKALRYLQSADVILYDNLVDDGVLDLARRDARRLFVGKKGRSASFPQEEINRLLIAEAMTGANVVRLKGGDPFIFGRGGEELEALKEAGIDATVVPGITAAIGAASFAGLPLTHRDLAHSVRFLTGHRASSRDDMDWSDLAKPGQTLVFYMGLLVLPDIAARLLRAGIAADMPVAVIENATRPESRMVLGSISDIVDQVAKQGINGPTVVIIGRTIAFQDPKVVS